MAQVAPAGARNRRITLQRSVVTYNALNEPVDAWRDLATVWAARDDVSGAERVRADAEQGTVTKFFTLLWAAAWADLSPKDRVLYAGKAFNIRAIAEIGLHHQLVIEAFAPADQAALPADSVR